MWLINKNKSRKTEQKLVSQKPLNKTKGPSRISEFLPETCSLSSFSAFFVQCWSQHNSLTLFLFLWMTLDGMMLAIMDRKLWWGKLFFKALINLLSLCDSLKHIIYYIALHILRLLPLTNWLRMGWNWRIITFNLFVHHLVPNFSQEDTRLFENFIIYLET